MRWRLHSHACVDVVMLKVHMCMCMCDSSHICGWGSACAGVVPRCNSNWQMCGWWACVVPRRHLSKCIHAGGHIITPA